jgi:hypothetical protein
VQTVLGVAVKVAFKLLTVTVWVKTAELQPPTDICKDSVLIPGVLQETP